MAIPYVEEVEHVSSYPLLEYMGFDADISGGEKKTRAATLLGYNVHFHKCTKNPLKYVHTDSKYGNLFKIPVSSTQESFSISER